MHRQTDRQKQTDYNNPLLSSSVKKYSKCNSFQVTTDLLNSDNFKVGITQLCNEVQVWNFTML